MGAGSRCFGYVPDMVELARGAYEGEGYFFDFWTDPFESGVENFIATGFKELRKKANKE